MTAELWDTLPCGRSPERLLNLAAEHEPIPEGTHEATCPYCQTALGEFGELWHPVREWAQQPVDLPPHLLTSILRRVRRLVQSPHHIAVSTTRGATTVTSWVLGLIATGATQDTPGVANVTSTPGGPQPRSGRRRAIRYGADGVDITEVGAAAVAVTLGITGDPVPKLADLADLVRRNVITAVARDAGIETAEVDITIDDISLPPTTTEP